MASYFNCGFARVAVHNIVELGKKSNRIQLHGNQESELKEKFHKRFQNRATFAIDNDNFIRNAKKLISFFHKKWNPKTAREEYLAQFSEDSWKKLSPQAKALHSMKNCEGCLQTFPL